MNSTLSKYIHPINLNGITLPNNLWLAPLAGYSHKALRITSRNYGAGYTVTEMVSIDGVINHDKNTWRMLDLENELTGIQLFGRAEPNKYYQAATLLRQELGARIIDVNFGCPVRKVVRNRAGAFLLNNPSAMAEIISAVKEAGVIATAKIRSGYQKMNYAEVLSALNAARPAFIVIHPRLGTDFFKRQADWQVILKAREFTDLPIIANGDITTPERAREVFEKTGADGIMIGRAAIGKPYLFRQIHEYFQTGSYHQPGKDEIKRMMLDFARLYLQTSGQNRLNAIRSTLLKYVKGFEHSTKIRSQLAKCTTMEELEEIIRES